MKKMLLLPVLLFSLTGCSTYLAQSENISGQKKSYDKILVVGRTSSTAARVLFEREVAAQLQAKGVSAEASTEHLSDLSLGENPGTGDRQAIRESLVNAGYDGVIVTNLVDTQQYTDVIPGTARTAYVGGRYGRFGQYYGYYPITTWGPDYVETGTRYVFESTLYSLDDSNGGLQWVGTFRLKDPTDIRKAVGKYASELTAALMLESIAP